MKIVVAYDGTEGAQKAAHASLPTAQASGATLLLLNALDPRSDLAEARGSHEEALRATTAQVEAEARGFIESLHAGAEVRVVVTERGEDPGETIARALREEGADLVFIATRRAGGLSGFFLGSVTQQLIGRSPCPVAVVRV